MFCNETIILCIRYIHFDIYFSKQASPPTCMLSLCFSSLLCVSAVTITLFYYVKGRNMYPLIIASINERTTTYNIIRTSVSYPPSPSIHTSAVVLYCMCIYNMSPPPPSSSSRFAALSIADTPYDSSTRTVAGRQEGTEPTHGRNSSEPRIKLLCYYTTSTVHRYT